MLQLHMTAVIALGGVLKQLGSLTVRVQKTFGPGVSPPAVKATDEPWHPLMMCCASDYGRYYCIESGTLPAITLVVLCLLINFSILCSLEFLKCNIITELLI